MAVNPNSLKNLEKAKRFEKGDSRIKKGRTKGSRNRRTIFLEWLNQKTECTDAAGNTVRLTLADKVALAIVQKAAEGHVSAASFVFDNAYGRVEDIPAEKPVERQPDWSKYTEEQLLQLIALMEIGKWDDEN